MFNFEMSGSEFRNAIYEKEPWLSKQCFDGLAFDWRVVDQALDMQDPTWELMKVLHNGRIDPSEYVEEYVDIGLRRRRIKKQKLYELLSRGATIVLNRAELISPPIREISSEIGQFVGAQTTSNVYACLGGPRATEVHWDTHDVFVVQLSGAKQWEVFRPTHPLPISSQVSNGRKNDLKGLPVIDTELRSGDVLYVPRGWWHRVTPVPGSDTIHLTVPVHSPLILDYFIWACASVVPDLFEARHGLIDRPGDEERVENALRAFNDALMDPGTREAFYTRCRERSRVISPFLINDILKNPFRQLSGNSDVRLNSQYLNLDDKDIFVNGSKLQLADPHMAIVNLLARGITNIAEIAEALPDIDRETIVNLIWDLIRADIVRLPGEKRQTNIKIMNNSINDAS